MPRLAVFPAAMLAGALLYGAAPTAAPAASINLAAGASLQAAIDSAQAGDTLVLAAGDYHGNIVIDKPLSLQGAPNYATRVIGERSGRSIWIKAADVSIRGLTVKNSGLSLPDMDAGIFLDKSAARTQVVDNQILDNSVGVYLWGATDARVANNRIVGNTELRVNERGNGVTVWNSPGSQVLNNDISEGRDGIFSNNSRANVFSGNTFSRLRYAVHYMYTNDSEVSDNISLGNEIGYALMFSRRLRVAGNVAADSSHQGLMLNATDESTVRGNAVINAEKCVFVYNSNLNQIQDNRFQGCEIGVHYTGSEGNDFYGNSFINNQNQVKYVGTRYIEWSHAGRGNYWSDMSGFDLDGDGIGDTAYRPNGIIDQVIWRAPNARLLLNSPAVSIVRWAQSQFPAILPGGVVDSAPLMAPPPLAAFERYLKHQ